MVTPERIEEAFLRRLIEALDSRFNELRKGLSESWADVDERRFVDSGTQMPLQAQSENAERIDFILAYAAVGANQAMMIELGTEHKIVVPPNPAGSCLFQASCKVRLSNSDQRVISVVTLTNGNPGTRGSGTAGFLYMHLGGKEIPPGALRW